MSIDKFTEWNGCLKSLREMLARDHAIEHVTIQIELDGQSCGDAHGADGNC